MSEYPQLPQPGDFAVLPISGPVGKLIALGERLNGDAFTQYQHAVVYVGNGQTMGAYPGGAHIRPLPAQENGWLWSHVNLTEAERAAIVNSALACQGIRYSALDYFALAAHRLEIPAPGLRDYIEDTRHLICSQLVDFCYMSAGVHLFNDNRWPGYVTPASLAFVIEHPEGIVRG